MGSYTIPSSLYLLETSNTQIKNSNLSTRAQIQLKFLEESQGCTKEYAGGDLMHQGKNVSF